MKSHKYNREVSLMCATCGGTQFEFSDSIPEAIREYECKQCNRVYSKEELYALNRDNLEAHKKEIGEEVVRDATKELKKSLEKAFRGNKNIRFK